MKKTVISAFLLALVPAVAFGQNHSSAAYASMTPKTVAARSVSLPTRPPTGIDPTTSVPGAYSDGSAGTIGQIAHMADGSVQQTDIGTKVPSLSGGQIINPISTTTGLFSGDLLYGVKISDPKHSGELTKLYYNANTWEFTIENSAAANNTLAIKNTNPCGLAATTFVGYDQQYTRIMEHAAIGWGGCLSYHNTHGFNYLEISRYPYAVDGSPDETNIGHTPVPFLLQKTGNEFIPINLNESYGAVTKGSNQIKCVGCTWGAGMRQGQGIDTPDQPGLFPNETTYVSGAGTDTITVSNAALLDAVDNTAGTWITVGDLSLSQYDWFEDTAMGCLNLWTFGGAKYGAFYGAPFVCFDRVHGKTGFGGERHPVLPVDSLGGVGGNISGQHADRSFYAGGALNAQVTPGVDGQNSILHAFGVGDNQYNAVWLKNPSRIQYRDSNGNAVVAEHYMDGTWASRHPAHPIQNVTADFAINSTDQCDTTLVVNSASAVSVTVTDWLLTGCRITVTQAGSGAVTLVPASGLTLASNSESGAPATGNYVLAGQYASVVLEAKSAHLTTVERGQ